MLEVRVDAGPEQVSQPRTRNRVPLDELARRKDVRQVALVEDMAQDGVFSSDDEVDEFLAHIYASRHADLA